MSHCSIQSSDHVLPNMMTEDDQPIMSVIRLLVAEMTDWSHLVSGYSHLQKCWSKFPTGVIMINWPHFANLLFSHLKKDSNLMK